MPIALDGETTYLAICRNQKTFKVCYVDDAILWMIIVAWTDTLRKSLEYTGCTRQLFENKEIVSEYILSFTNVIFKVTYWPTFNYLTYAQCKRNLYLKNFVWNTDFSKSSFCLKSNSYITKITRATSTFKWPDSFLLL